MKRALMVAGRELHVTVRRKSYLWATFGTPVMIGLFVAVIGIFTARSVEKEDRSARTYAVVDSSDVLDARAFQSLGLQSTREAPDTLDTRIAEIMEGLPEGVRDATVRTFPGILGTVDFVQVADPDSALEAVRRGDLDGFFAISADYLESGRVWQFGKARSIFNDDGDGPPERAITRALTLSLLRREGVSSEGERRILRPARITTFELRQGGEQAGEFQETGIGTVMRSFALPYGFSLLMMMTIIMSGSFLLQGVAEEKENRVIEVILSTVTTDELLMGKVLGLGAAGLIQMGVWLTLGGALLSGVSGMVPDIGIPWSLFLLAVLYYVLGYLMISSLMAGFGSLLNTQRESQQFAGWFVMPMVLPLILMVPILAEPNGFLARLLSYIPITSPVSMMIRLPTEQVPWTDIPITILILVLTTWLAIRIGAKVFRLGSLMYGKRPTLPEIFKWLRQA